MSKKKLSKGFDDLFSQNETDLSFLDTYGKTNLEYISGLPESTQNHQNSDELFDVILRLLKSEKVGIKSTSKKITLGKFLLVTKKNNQIEISIKSETLSLPLVRERFNVSRIFRFTSFRGFYELFTNYGFMGNSI